MDRPTQSCKARAPKRREKPEKRRIGHGHRKSPKKARWASRTRWAPTASNSSNMPRPTPSCCARCSPAWASLRSPATSARTSPSTARATAISSSMPSPAASPRNSPATTARAPAPWRSASRTPRPPTPARSSLGATDVQKRRRRWRARHSGDRGHRRVAALSSSTAMRDSGSIYDVDFDFHPDWREREAAADRKLTYIDHLTHNVNRGQDGDLGRFLREALQLPRDPLLRHRGQGHRPVLQGDDQPVRQDPHPAEREPGRQEPDRGIPARI